MNGEFSLDGVVSDEEVEDEENVGCGEDSPGVVVDHLDTLQSVPAALLLHWGSCLQYNMYYIIIIPVKDLKYCDIRKILRAGFSCIDVPVRINPLCITHQHNVE